MWSHDALALQNYFSALFNWYFLNNTLIYIELNCFFNIICQLSSDSGNHQGLISSKLGLMISLYPDAVRFLVCLRLISRKQISWGTQFGLCICMMLSRKSKTIADIAIHGNNNFDNLFAATGHGMHSTGYMEFIVLSWK